MRRQIIVRQHNISVEHAITAFLHHCKGRRINLHALCEYEDALNDFFQGGGTEFIEDITKGSPFAYIDAVSLSDVEEYKALRIARECLSTL